MLSTEMNSAVPMKRPKLSTDATTQAAGLMIVTKQGRALFLRRRNEGGFEGEWAWPAGKIEDGETPKESAIRETREETGWEPEFEVKEIDNNINDRGTDFTTFRTEVDDEFIPKLNEEHSGHAWASLDDPPEPLHPGCRRAIDMAMDAAKFEEGKHPRGQPGNAGQFGPGGGGAGGEGRAEGETDKQFAKRVVDKRQAPKELPENYNDYFNTEGAQVIPLDKLVSAKSDEENAQGAENGAKRMEAAAKGELGKRGPIEVQKMPDGRFMIVDGNGTYSSVKKYGWKGIPAKLSEGASKSYNPGIVAQGLENASAKKKQWAEISPIKAKEDLWSEGAIKNQEALAKVSAPIAQSLGLMFKDPGIKGASDKGKARIQEKIDEGKPPNRINDGVRAGFKINTPGQADKIVEGLSKHFEIADEGWEVTDAGYFDRKVMVRFDDGQVGEVQIWHPELLNAKENKGHKLYEDWRTLRKQMATGEIPPDDPRSAQLVKQMREVYNKVHKGMSPDWISLLGRGGSVPVEGGGGKPGNMDSKRALDSKAACIDTSMLGASRHSPLRKTNAFSGPGKYNAGSPSHEQYRTVSSVILDSFQILKRFENRIIPTYAFDDKISKVEARYTDGPVDTEPCNRCSMYRDLFCTAVVGEISPNGHCKLWESDGRQPAQDAKIILDSFLILKAFDEFKESDHPRDESGKFGSGGGEKSVHEMPSEEAEPIMNRTFTDSNTGSHAEIVLAGKVNGPGGSRLRQAGIKWVETPEAARGKGGGHAVMKQVTAHLDKHGIPAVLNTNADLHPFYEKHGFVPARNRDGTLNKFEMIREPKSIAKDAAANEATEKELRTTIKYPPPKSNSLRVIDQSFARGGLKQGESLHYAPKAQAYENRGGHDAAQDEWQKDDDERDSETEQAEMHGIQRPSWAVNGAQPKIDRTHTTEWLSVLSRDGETFFIDSSIPEQVEIGGKTLDPAEPLIRHECSEFEWMQTLLSEMPGEPDDDERLKIYYDSHTKAGTVSERACIEELGINWKEWSAWCRGEESRLSKRGPGDNPVPDPDVKPAPHRHGELESVAEDQALVLAYDKSILVNLGNGLYVKAPRECLAFDERTARFYDKDARLHLAVSNISKAVVNPYLGKEIPEFEQLGLEPNRIYRLYRDPEELAKAAPTFNGIPVLSEHVAVDAMNHRPDLVIGATGTDANFANPYLQNSLVFWAGDAIQDIESEEKKELSSAYRYRADMTPGSVQGEKFDGVMRGIIGNHVALVKEGRAGSDVVVGDSKENVKMPEKVKPRQMSRQAAIAVSVLSAHLRPKLAKDAKLPLFSLLEGVTTKNFQEKKPGILSGLKSKLKLNAAEIKKFKGKPKIAMDATIGEVAELLDMIENHGVEGDNDDMIDVPKPVEQMAQPVPEAGMGSKEKPPMLPEGSPEEEAGESPEQEAAEMAEGEGGDPTAEVQGLLAGKVDDATLAKVMEIIKSAGAHAHDNEEMAEKGAEDAEGGEEKLKELGAADELEEDANSDKGTGTGKGAPGGGSGSAEDSLEEDANSDKGTGTGKGSPGGGSGSAEDEEMDEKEKAAKDKRIGKDNPPPFKGMPKPGGTMVTQDSVNAAIKAATDTERKNQRAIREAERVVRPLVGEISIAFDSADEVYKNALTMLGVKDADKIHPSAYPQLLDMCRQTRQHNSSASPIAADMAMDEGDDSSYQEMFPEADHIGTV